MKILKIGGSLITRKSGYRELDARNLQKIAKVVASIWKKGVRDFVLVHGAGSFGHSLVIKYGINDGVKSEKQKLGYADTHAACSELSLFLVHALIKEGVPALFIPPAVIIEQKGRRISKFYENPIHDYLKRGFLPVLYGDMVLDSMLLGSVCSGDQIVAYLGKNAEFTVFATNVDGVIDNAGNVIPKITAANFAEISKHLKKKEGDVTGAMEGKIKELLELDTVSYIVNGIYPERIKALMLGKKRVVCTEVRKK